MVPETESQLREDIECKLKSIRLRALEDSGPRGVRARAAMDEHMNRLVQWPSYILFV